MNKVYKAYFLKRLREHLEKGELVLPSNFPNRGKYLNWKEVLYRKEWVVYAKPPFGGVKNVVKYLARYSQGIAISNHRIVNIDSKKVIFKYKNYKTGGQQKQMSLEGQNFLQRFCLHILPPKYIPINIIITAYILINLNPSFVEKPRFS